MKCLRCGFCCIKYSVSIIDDVKSKKVSFKSHDTFCKHLRGNKPGGFSCAIHKHKIFKDTPCAAFTQIENQKDNQCRLGKYFLNKSVKELKKIGLIRKNGKHGSRNN